MSEQKQLAIKMNNTATNDPCAICGARTDPIIGPEIFLADTWELVCHDCGWKHGPGLMAMMLSWRVTTGYILTGSQETYGLEDPDAVVKFLVNNTGSGSVDPC